MRIIQYAREAGHELTFSSAYRSREKQKYMVENNIDITPAENSLHMAGLAVDVSGSTNLPEASKLAIRTAASRRTRSSVAVPMVSGLLASS